MGGRGLRRASVVRARNNVRGCARYVGPTTDSHRHEQFAARSRWRRLGRLTRSAARAAGAVLHLTGLPTDALGLVLYHLTLAHDIAAVAPTCHTLSDAAKIALKLRPFSGEVVTLVGQTGNRWCEGRGGGHDGRIITGSSDHTVKVWRDGACERTIQAHDSTSWRCCRAEPLRQRLGRQHREAVDARRRSRAYLRGGIHGCNYATVAARGVHFVVGVGQRGGPAVPRRRDARPHLQARARCGRGGDARRPAHHQRRGQQPRQGVERRHQEPREHLQWAHPLRRGGGGDARQPAHPQRLERQHRPRLAPQRHPREHLHAAHRRRGHHRGTARQPARTLRPRATRPSSSSTSTTAPSCAPSSTTKTLCAAWRCCPTASVSSAARPTRPPASSSTASRRSERPGVRASVPTPTRLPTCTLYRLPSTVVEYSRQYSRITHPRALSSRARS